MRKIFSIVTVLTVLIISCVSCSKEALILRNYLNDNPSDTTKAVVDTVKNILNDTAKADTPIVVVTPPVSTEMKLLMLDGQSNLCGRAYTGQFIGEYAYLNRPVDTLGYKVFINNIATNARSYDLMRAGINTSDKPSMVGMQTRLAYNLVLNKKEDIYINQAARGGWPIEEWSDTRKSMWKWVDSSVTAFKALAAASGKSPKFEGFVWYQGETNFQAITRTDTATYAKNFKKIVVNLRAITRPDLPIIMIKMSDCQGGVANLKLLQAVQEDLAVKIPNVYLVKGGPNVCLSDYLHIAWQQHIYNADKVSDILLSL